MRKQLGLAVLIASLAGCGGERSPRREAANEPAVKVETAVAQMEEWPQEYQATGTVRAETSAALASEVNGRVLEVRAHEGDRVTAGQVLVVLDAREQEAGVENAAAMKAEAASALPELEAAITAAKSNRDLAEATYARMKDLYAQKSISPQEFDEAEARVKAARANYEMTVARRAQIKARMDSAEQAARTAGIHAGYTRIAAPFAGTVTARNVEPGALATVGTPLLTVERAGAFRLEADVEERKARTVKVGQEVRYALDAVGCAGTGRVAEVVPAVDPLARTYVVKVPVACEGARSGMFGRAWFGSGMRSVLPVAEGAVVTKGQLEMALVAEEGVAHSRLLTLGERRDGKAEVLSGLSAGERVIVKPGAMTDGERVEVKP